MLFLHLNHEKKWWIGENKESKRSSGQIHLGEKPTKIIDPIKYIWQCQIHKRKKNTDSQNENHRQINIWLLLVAVIDNISDIAKTTARWHWLIFIIFFVCARISLCLARSSSIHCLWAASKRNCCVSTFVTCSLLLRLSNLSWVCTRTQRCSRGCCAAVVFSLLFIIILLEHLVDIAMSIYLSCHCYRQAWFSSISFPYTPCETPAGSAVLVCIQLHLT